MVETLPPASLSAIGEYEDEWAALRECVSPCPNTPRLLKCLQSVDWSRMLLLAQEHRVIGQLAAFLSDPAAPAVPVPVKQAILDRQRMQNFVTLRLTAELFRVLELFAAKGISALVVKGPVLAVRAYGDPGLRSYGDLDLLVRHRDIRRATEALISEGYEPAVSLDAIDAGKIPGQYLFSKPDLNLLVELHNDRTLRYFPRTLPIEDYFARQIRVRLDAREVPAFAVEDELVLICIHGAKHFWERLSWIADVAGLLSRQREIDWESATASAKTVEAEHLLHTGLRLAEDVLREKLPAPIAARVRKDAVAAKLVERVLHWLPAAGYAPPALFERAAFRMRMRCGALTGPAYLLKLSFSPTEEDWQANGKLSQNRFLDVLRRPFRLARKYGRSRS